MTTIRIACIWFFSLGGVGMFYPFFALYLHDSARLGGTQIGLVLGVAPLIGIFSQPLWGWIGDRTGRRVSVLTVLAMGAAVGYELLALPRSFSHIAFASAFLALFSTALVPAMWSVTLAFLSERGMHAVGWVRVCGTFAFGLSAVSFPWLAAVGANAMHLSRMFPLAASFLFVAAAVAATLPRRGAVAVRAASGDARLLLNHTAFLRVLCVTFLSFLCLQGPMSIFPLLVEAQGGGVRAISRMWILMLSLEVPLIAAFGWTVQRLSLRVVVLLGIASAAVRWLVTGFASNLAIVTAAQALHGVAVWGLLLGTPAYVDAIVSPRLRSTAQGVLGTVGFGIATVVSSAAAGWLTEHLGSAAPARCAGIGTLVLSVFAASILPDPRRLETQHMDLRRDGTAA